MISFASGWPAFWTIIGGGVVVVALLSALVGSPKWLRRGQVRPTLAAVRHDGEHQVTEHATAA